MTSYPTNAASERIPATQWIRPNKTARAFGAFDYRSGQGVSEQGERLRARKYPPLSAVVSECAAAGIERLFWVGPWPKKSEWFYGELPEGWSPGTHWTAGVNKEPIYRFENADGRKLEFLQSTEWFGKIEHSPEQAVSAMKAISSAIAKEFDGFALKSLPGATGRHIWQSSIQYREWSCIERPAQELLWETSIQARIEHFLPRAEPIAGFHEVDQRWAYAAHCRELATGPVKWLAHPADHGYFLPKRPYRYLPGWFHVRFSAPSWWPYIGLLAVKGEPNTWPMAGETWAGAFELTQAADMGWTFEVLEGFTLEKNGPLDSWAGRRDRPTGLIRAEQYAREFSTSPEIARLASAGIKGMLRATIGGFFSRGADVQKSVHVDELARNPEAIPPSAGRPTRKGDHLVWTEKSVSRNPELQHPEWSMQVWDKARRSITLAALDVDKSSLLGIATDALYSTEPVAVDDRGRPGDFKNEGWHAAPGTEWRPSNLDELRAARAVL